MKEFKYNIKILLRKKELYYCIIGVLLINAIHVILVINHYSPNMILKTGEYQFILYNNEVTIMSLVIIALPILTSLVLSDTSWNDKHLGYNNYLYTRLNIKKNIFSRLFLSFITTFIICFVGFILNYLTLRFIFGSGNLITNFQELPYDQVIASEFFLDSIRYYNPILFIILISLHESVFFFIFYKAKINYLFSSYSYYDYTRGCFFFYWYQPVFNHKAVTAKFIVLGLSKYYFIYCTFFNSYYTSFVNYKER